MACNFPKNTNPNRQNSMNVQTNDTATTPPSSTPSPPPVTTTIATATIAAATVTPSAPPGPKLTITQQICMLEEKMTKEECGMYLDA
jgi:hypothetical protein